MPSVGFRLLPVLSICLPLLVSSAAANRADAPSPQVSTPAVSVVRVYYGDVEDIRALMDFDLWEYNNAKDGYVLVAVDPDEYVRLEALGFPLVIDEPRTEQRDSRTVPASSGVEQWPG